MEQENFPLDEAVIGLLEEYERQQRDINVARQATLALFMRQQRLTGRWRLAANARELERDEAYPVAAGNAASGEGVG